MTTEQIAAIFSGVVTVLTALFGFLNARQNRKIADLQETATKLQSRVEHLETALASSKEMRKAALRWARELRQYARDVITAHRLGEPLPIEPPPPVLIAEEA